MNKRRVYLIAVLEADEYDASLTFDDATCGDYIVHAIFDYESDKFVFLDDNIHNDPYTFLDGFIAGITVMGEDVDIREVIVYVEGSTYNTHSVRCALEKYIEEEE